MLALTSVYNSPGGEEGAMHGRESREQGDEQIVEGLLGPAACECKESHT